MAVYNGKRIDFVCKTVSEGSGITVCEFIVPKDDVRWTEVNGRYQVRIEQTDHNLTSITSITVEKKSEDDAYERILYAYKRYTSGSVAIILDLKLDIRIIIKGVK